MPLLPALVAKAFYFDEVATGKPHPPRAWGSRLDFAKRFAPPVSGGRGGDGRSAPPSGITLTLSSTDATLREAGAALARGGPAAALDGRLPQDLLVTATAEGGGERERRREVGARTRAKRIGFFFPSL